MHTPCNKVETRFLIKQARCDHSVRYCRKCEKSMSLDQFDPGEVRFFCSKHLREILRWYRQGDQGRRAVNNLRVKCWTDKATFGQPTVGLSCQDIRNMMTPDQIKTFSRYAIVPKDPTQILSASNALLITANCRKYLVASWKITQDTEQYQEILQIPKFKLDFNK